MHFIYFLWLKTVTTTKLAFIYFITSSQKKKVILNFTSADVCHKPLEQENNLTSVSVDKYMLLPVFTPLLVLWSLVQTDTYPLTSISNGRQARVVERTLDWESGGLRSSSNSVNYELWPWGSHLTILGLSFLICKMRGLD